MNEKEIFNKMVEDGALAIINILNIAIMIGDYKKANEILDFLLAEESNNGKINEDILVV